MTQIGFDSNIIKFCLIFNNIIKTVIYFIYWDAWKYGNEFLPINIKSDEQIVNPT